MENKDLMLLIFGIISGVLLFLFTKTALFVKMPKLRILFLIPVIAALHHIDGAGPELPLIGLYAGCAITALLAISEKGRAAIFALSIASMLSAAVLCPLSDNYRSAGYARDFEKCFNEMKQTYVLTEHKGIDWDALYDEYMPTFREADKNDDVMLCYEVGKRFAMEFNDPHVNFAYNSDEYSNEELMEKYELSHCGNNYGFSLIRLADGRTVFVNTDENDEDEIHDGLEIISIDGEDIDDLIGKAYLWTGSFYEKDNAGFYAPLAATASKTDDIEIVYIGEDGERHTAKRQSDGKYLEKYNDTIRILNSENEKNNFYHFMVDENTGCLVLNGMDDNTNVIASDEALEWAEAEGYDTETLNCQKYGNMTMQVGYEITKLKQEGAENLIIDLRNNHGGFIAMVKAIASLFTSEEIFIANEGEILPDGSYGIYEAFYTAPDNKWGDGDIVILVNAATASAGEIFTYCMKQLDNVTVMGLTKTAGCAQGTNAIDSGNMTFSCPRALMLDENGDVLIDPDTDRICHFAPDIMIPLDDEVLKQIFTEKTDYVLNKANEYLDSK